MDPLYLLLVPGVITLVYCLRVKYRQKEYVDLTILAVLFAMSLTNVVLIYKMINTGLSVPAHLVQMSFSSLIIPLVFLYIMRQITHHAYDKSVLGILFLLVAFTFVPQIIITNPFEPFVLPEDGLKPFSFYILSHGRKVVALYTGDLVAVLQSIIVLGRIAFFMYQMRGMKLHLVRRAYLFGALAAVVFLFSAVISSMGYADLRTEAGRWFFFGSYCSISVIMGVLIALGYEVNPLETEEGEVVQDLHVYIHQQYGSMAMQLKKLMEEENLFTDPNLTSERVMELLNTNHTYLSQMMSSQWGMSFSDYVNGLRLDHVQKLLKDPSLTISSVAQMSGFSDAGYMSRRFKAKYGMTPSDWRKSMLD